ncbi:MAG: hypothetical protein WAN11_28100 [Syntrophobacteraceae bacterium]
MNSFAATFQKLRRSVYQMARSGIRVILFDIPLLLVAFVNDGLICKLFNIPRFKEFQRVHADELHNHFYIIVMPNTLHFLVPCLRLIPNTVNVLLILNGVDAWEEEYLKVHCRDHSIFRLTTFCHSSLSHGSVVNLLIDHNDSNFGILDHDLYVFNPTIFSRLKFAGDEVAIGAIKWTWTGPEIPRTHFLFFNIELVKKIRNKYRIGAQIYTSIPYKDRIGTQGYTSIPSRLKPLLASPVLCYINPINWDDFTLDTLTMLFSLALYDKLSFKFLEATADDLFHIGETSFGTRFSGNKPYLNYIGLRFIELLQESTLAEHYSSLYDHVSASQQLLRELHRMPPTAAAISRFEKGIARIKKRIDLRVAECVPV